MKIFIDICNAAKIMLLGKGLSLTVGHGRAFISIIKSSARVESLGTALASTILQAKPAWARVRLNKFLNVYSLLLGERKKKKKKGQSPFQ